MEKTKLVEKYSNCCGAKMTEPDLDGAGKCLECKENCIVDTLCIGCNQEEMTYKQFINQYGICSWCAYLS